MAINVLVVDDEVKILEVVKSYLEKDNYHPFTAQTGLEALDIFEREPISLVLLDLMLPDLAGEEVCKKIRQKSKVPIIMMTARVDEESIIYGLSIGADDYVTKPFSPRQLMARVAAVLRRSEAHNDDSRVLEYKNLTVSLPDKRVLKNHKTLALTPHEYNILALLMGRPHKIFTRDDIINQVKADDYEVYDRAIDSHIKNLRQKIEDDPKNPQFILTVYGMGYRFGKDE